MSRPQATRSMGALSVLVLLVSCIFPTTGSQMIGAEVCSCSPSTYKFEFDFSLTCPPIDIEQGEGTGIESSFCIVAGMEPGVDIDDLMPVSVQSVQIIELDYTLTVITRSDIPGSFKDGDTFSYTSVSAGDITSLDEVPGGLQMVATGLNAFDQTLTLVWVVAFTNQCGTKTIFEEGASAGWTVFESLTPPRPEYCPGTTALDPTISPVTNMPSGVPSVAPVVAPVTGPTVTDPPTGPEPPTTAPVPGPAPSPVSLPTGPVATRMPSMSMSMSYSMSFHYRRLGEVMNEAELFEFGRAI